MVILRKDYEAMVRESENLKTTVKELTKKVADLSADLQRAKKDLGDAIQENKDLTQYLESRKKQDEEEAKEMEKFKEESEKAYNELSNFGANFFFDPSCNKKAEKGEVE